MFEFCHDNKTDKRDVLFSIYVLFPDEQLYNYFLDAFISFDQASYQGSEDLPIVEVSINLINSDTLATTVQAMYVHILYGTSGRLY